MGTPLTSSLSGEPGRTAHRGSRGISDPPKADLSVGLHLAEVLEEELQIHRALLEVGRRKQGELVGMDLAAIEKSSREEQTLMSILSDVAVRRRKAQDEAAAQTSLSGKEATVSRIAQKLALGERVRLFDLAQKVKGVIAEVKRVTRTNQILTEQSLHYVKDFFEVLFGVATEGKTYERSGRAANPVPGRLLIDQVA